MAIYITTIILLFILFEKMTILFLEKKIIVLGFYGVVKSVVSFKVVLTLPPCIPNRSIPIAFLVEQQYSTLGFASLPARGK